MRWRVENILFDKVHARLREIIASTRCGGEKTFGLKLYVGVYAARQRVIEKISSRECRNYRIYL